MYRGLTGHYPFTGPTPMAVFTKHLTESAIPPHERGPELGIPPGVSEIVLRALEKNPADRWQKVEDLQAALAQFAAIAEDLGVEQELDGSLAS